MLRRKKVFSNNAGSSMYIRYEYISYFMFSKKMSEVEFCKNSNILPEDLIKIKFNNHEISLKSICNVCEYMNISLSTLVGDLDFSRKWNDKIE